MSGLILPSYKAGYAHYAGEALFPELWKGLIGHWNPSLGSTGLALRDTSGKHSHGTLENMNPSSDWVVGPDGYALDFNGTNQHVVIGETVSSPPVSMSCWFRTVDTTTGQTLIIIENTGSNVSGDWVRLTAQGNAGSDPLRVQSTHQQSGSGTVFADTTTGYSSGIWHHAVCVVTASDVQVWIDGGSDSTTVGATTWGTINSTSIGYWKYRAQQPMNGQISDVAIWNRVLTPNEIQTLSQHPNAISQRKSRQYWFAPAGGPSFQAAWANGLNSQIGAA